jgi:prevent-host-death family protein
MTERAISVTEAARNFADCINRVRYQGLTFVLHKNGVPVARIVPEVEKSNTGQEQAAALSVAGEDVLPGEKEAAARPYDSEESPKGSHPSSGTGGTSEARETRRRVPLW